MRHKRWAAVVNRHGGDARAYRLEIGIKGNTHFPFSDLTPEICRPTFQISY